ncbi:MAG TPA: hypothetical protein VE985_05755 [Gaiellaceae bacterium]|nr:hypothetical protein [Gaiellaceae bacterium]
MRSALIAALVSAVVASGSAVAATRLINGHLIQNHSIPETKLTEAAIASLHGKQGQHIAFTLVRGPAVVVQPGDGSGASAGQSSALCASGSYPVGGGYLVTEGYGADPVVVGDGPDTSDGKTADGWDVVVGNLTQLGATMPLTFHAWATCEAGAGPITIPGA